MTDLRSESSGLGCTRHVMRMAVEAAEPPVDAGGGRVVSLDAEILRVAAPSPGSVLPEEPAGPVFQSSAFGRGGLLLYLTTTSRVTLG